MMPILAARSALALELRALDERLAFSSTLTEIEVHG